MNRVNRLRRQSISLPYTPVIIPTILFFCIELEKNHLTVIQENGFKNGIKYILKYIKRIAIAV
jgi:hypothetical protein